MRFIGRGPQEDCANVDDADIVVQIGTEKTRLTAAQLRASNMRVSRSPALEALQPSDPSSPHPRTITVTSTTSSAGDYDDDKALEALSALSHMQDALAPITKPKPVDHEPCAGPWSPYSPDDAYPYTRQPSQPPSAQDSQTLPRLCRQPSDAALPAYYDPVQCPYYISQQTSASAVRDMALHKGAPTIFDSVGLPHAPPPRLSSIPNRSEDKVRRDDKLRSSKTRSRALDLVNLFPNPRSSGGPQVPPPRLSQSPSAMAVLPLPPSSDRKLRKSRTIATSHPGTGTSSGGGGGGRGERPFDESILDQHKTNVRRPPKGIQNWFDAYPDDDDEEEDDDDEEEDLDAETSTPGPQELPGEDVLPPAYSVPNRHSSLSAFSPQTPHNPHHRPQQPAELALEQARSNWTSHSSTSGSIRSSQLGSMRQTGQGRLAASTLSQESVVSLSSAYEDEEHADEEEDEDEDDDENGVGRDRKHYLPTIRDSIFDDRNIMIGNASALDVVKVPKPAQLNHVRASHQSESRRSLARSSTSMLSTQRRDKSLAMSPHQGKHSPDPITAEALALRRLNGLSVESDCTTGSTETSNTGLTVETRSSGTSYEDTVNGSPQDSLQMVAITEEEKMLLDMMRQKRVAMQQMSFTEGYQLALRTEQQRSDKRTTTVEERALTQLKRKESKEHYRASELSAPSPTPTQETDMRRQLSDIRKESVDESFQMERFLNMPQPAPLSSHPPNVPPARRKPRAPSAPSGELLPSTTYSRATSSAPAISAVEKSEFCSPEECEAEYARMRVQQFISSKGAVPPFNSGMKTMRRNTSRQPINLTTSPLTEEDQHNNPPVPTRNTGGHVRDTSQCTVSTSNHHLSPTSIYDEPRETSPVSALSGHYSPNPKDSPQSVQHDRVLLPPKSDGRNRSERELSKSISQPQLKSGNPPRLSVNTASPFGTLISAASRVSMQRPPTSHIASQYRRPHVASSTDIRPATAHGGVHGIGIVKIETSQKPTPRPRVSLPKLNTMDHVVDARASMLSITSAGEEVLNAWAELGGGQDCLQTKVRHRMS